MQIASLGCLKDFGLVWPLHTAGKPDVNGATALNNGNITDAHQVSTETEGTQILVN